MTLLPGGRDQQIGEERLAHRTEDGHWLVFGEDRMIVGCVCGFDADTEQDAGYGDSVLDHFEAVVRADERAKLKDALLKFSAVMAHGNGYRADAIPKASLLDVFALAER